MRREEKPLSELAKLMIALPQVLVNARVAEKKGHHDHSRDRRQDRRRGEKAGQRGARADSLFRHRTAPARHDRRTGQVRDHHMGQRNRRYGEDAHWRAIISI